MITDKEIKDLGFKFSWNDGNDGIEEIIYEKEGVLLFIFKGWEYKNLSLWKNKIKLFEGNVFTAEELKSILNKYSI